MRIPEQEPGEEESGQLMILLIGYVLLALLLATVVAAASSIYIEHKKLLSAADGAAVAAADSFTLSGVVGGDGPPAAQLSQARINGAVAAYLQLNNSYERFAALSVDPATGSPDGHTAVVTLTAVVRPVFINFLVPDGIPITATGTARSQLTR
ncbi:pilus assembly protein TadG-related protein [Arthrobacter sp. 35W]|uniref:pilus assembly protein TadG-related protein n=1 Tax=Arthrobacter sp. 35W TaxID=1132441 RepID=UPI001E4F79EE|nr:pilus assembly protein TadG-related protein [Arthrobacter sp. 35W]